MEGQCCGRDRQLGDADAFAPPLVVVGVKADSGTLQDVKAAQAFALNMLGKDQKTLAFTFFRPGRRQRRQAQRTSVPQGRDRSADPGRSARRSRMPCDRIVEQGDHHIVVGEVVEAHLQPPFSGRPDVAILEMKDLGDNVFYGG